MALDNNLRLRGANSDNLPQKASPMLSVSGVEKLDDDGDDKTSNTFENTSGSQTMSLEDKISMAYLFILYTLQAIPMGLCGSIPLILKERGTTYEGLSLFSLVSLPFSLKLLWAPIVDSCYFKFIGRRKTWLVPIQVLTGAIMIGAAPSVERWLGGGVDGGTATAPDVNTLTFFFLALYFLMATQDIAVDGWALTMLSKANVGYASTCNSIGQSFGVFLANQGFIALSDATWCQRHLGMTGGAALVTLPGFMQFWGWVFLVTTAVVCVAKSERPIAPEDEPEGLIETYQHVLAMFRLRPVQQLFLVLLTCRIAFAPADAVQGFKLQEYGMSKADIATVSPVLLVVSLFLPAVVGHYVTNRPLDAFSLGFPLKLLTSLLGWIMVQFTRSAYADGAEPSYFFFACLLSVMVLHEIGGTLMFVSCMSFFAKVSDPNIGGTYMTFLNTVANLGSKWPNSVALWFQPKLTVAQCHSARGAPIFNDNAISCTIDNGVACAAAGGVCVVLLDGFTVQTFACICFGVAWLFVFRALLNRMQSIPDRDWMVTAGSLANTPQSAKEI